MGCAAVWVGSGIGDKEKIMYQNTWSWLSWFVFGLVVGVGLNTAWALVKERVTIKWFEWGLTFLIVFGSAFMMQTFWASFDEWAPQAAWMSLVFLGVPIIVMAVVLVRSVQKRLA